ncbi:Zinc finger RING-type [Arabidopsis suecica]|uniref:Zinc finger RING-type n=1 Tax=Arabidopsis suecica TaxID=45249 RepID=A0A8T2AI21_ARASU|nr:Zinc finger RING-type [Arabidopsis suecica]
MALKHSMNIDSYESKSYACLDNSKDTVSVVLRIRGIKRVFKRSASGRETLIQQTTIGGKEVVEVRTEIPPMILIIGVELCAILLTYMLIDNGIHACIRDCVVVNIAKEAIKLHREKKGGRSGFLIVTQVGVIEETWFSDVIDHDDISEDHPDRLQTEQDSCTICLEALGESSTTKLLCSHSFHRDCIFQWLGHKLSCPVCRYNVI